ncbi:MAG TPA: HipA domain-containing protein [Thiolinea sp.]|nr:HipA domain-containing protein [Thiolinea sp.]
MTSKINAEQAYVWIWLPKQTQPVLAGQVKKQGQLHQFVYSRHYRKLADAIALSPLELPLQAGTLTPQGMNTLHACLRDAAPDAWGRRVLDYHYPQSVLGELDYLLLSGSDRIGALDFQASNTLYEPRQTPTPSLQDLFLAAELIERRQPLPPELDRALLHGTSVGGARPKALLQDQTGSYIAKFSTSSDSYDVVKTEYIAMQLAQLVGLNVAKTQLVSVLGKDVLLVECFDRIHSAKEASRRLLLSGLSLLGLNEMEARYASYQDLADLIRQQFHQPKANLHELFKRLVFNILIGNTDDHARNHAAFWDGQYLSLTPAYDLCPQLRSGQEASQAMQINGIQGNLSTLANALSICTTFQLEVDEAQAIINQQITILQENWTDLCQQAGLAKSEQERLWQKAILNPFCFH